MYRNYEEQTCYNRRATATSSFGRSTSRVMTLALSRPALPLSRLLPLLLVSFLITLIITSLVLILLGL